MGARRFLLLLTLCWLFVSVSCLTQGEYKTVVATLERLFEDKPFDKNYYLPANVVRAAFHDAGTFNLKTGSGGAHAVLFRNCRGRKDKCERSLNDNSGLDAARINLLKVYKHNHFDKVLSLADFLQLACLVAIEFTGGPTIDEFDFKWGRVDFGAEKSYHGVLPPSMASLATNRAFMGLERLGCTDEEILALLGAHTIGAAHRSASGHYGPWDWTPKTWDNGYYQNMASHGWWWNSALKQYERKWNGHTSIMLQADFAFWQDHSGRPAPGHLRDVVVAWARDERAWDVVFIRAWKKVSTNGAKLMPPCDGDINCPAYVPGKPL